MNKPIFKLFCLLAVLLFGCSQKTSEDISIEPYFCPNENCSNIMEHLIRNATESVNCAFYDLNLENLIDALSDKSRDIDVKLIVESDTLKGQIIGPGLKKDKNSALMHNKFCIIDKKTTTTGSMNPTHNDNEKNSNNLVIIKSNAAAEKFSQEFDEMWRGEFGKGSKLPANKIYSADGKTILEVYFCPEDSCADRLAKEIILAQNSVYFMAFSFTSQKISDAVISANNQNAKIDIRGILDSGQAGGKYSSFEKLNNSGIKAVKEKSKHKLHHKVFIIDNETVVTGSFNPTKNGDENNDENMIIIRNNQTAAQFLAEFDRLWYENNVFG